MRRVRIILWIVVVLAAIGFGALMLQRNRQPEPATTAQFTFPVSVPFTLTGADGQPFSSASLKGKPYVIFFGFTNCPDVCPTTLARLLQLRKQAGGDRERPAILFVTVDPERDRPAEVGKYASMFGAPIIGLTGSPAQIEQVKKQFGIYSKKVPDGSGGYSVDHTASALLFGADGKFIGTIAPDEPDSAALDKMKRLVAGS